MSTPKVLEWSMGFRNYSSQLYLTQESFGFRVNCNGRWPGLFTLPVRMVCPQKAQRVPLGKERKL
jgi:hypothetical protein